MYPNPVTVFHCQVLRLALLHAMIKMGLCHMYFIVVYSVCRFLLGKHKAAIEFYHEAARLNEKDWVNEKKHLSTEFLLRLKVCKQKCSVRLASFTLNT